MAILDSKQKQELSRRLVGLSMVSKLEFDIAKYIHEFDKLVNNMQNINLIFMDYGYLKIHKNNLSAIYKNNYKCLPMKVYDFLAVRPIEYIEDASCVVPEGSNGKIYDWILCCIKNNFDKKLDNSVIYMTTKQEIFVLKKDSIVYCQSDLKYTLFIIDDGKIMRKSEELQYAEEKYL